MKCFKMFGLFFASLAMLAMVGCGGGGGGSHSNPVVAPTTTNLNVNIPGASLGNNGGNGSLRAAVRASVAFDDLLRLRVEYSDNGVLKSDGTEDRKLTKNGSDYECKNISLLLGRDYRFSVFLANAPTKKLLENQISKDELKQDASVQVDEVSTLKTQVYDAWVEANPTISNKNFTNFVENTGKTVEELTDKAKVEELSTGAKAEDIKNQVTTFVKATETVIETAIKKAEEEGKKTEEIQVTELISEEDIPELEDLPTEVKPAETIGTEDLTPEALTTATGFAAFETLRKAKWEVAKEADIKPLVTYDNGKAAKVIYSYIEKWETLNNESYFVEAKVDESHLHYFVYDKINNVFAQTGNLFPHSDDDENYFVYDIKTGENKIISGNMLIETAKVGEVTYLRGTDQDADQSGKKKVFYMASVAMPADLKAAIEEIKNPSGKDDHGDNGDNGDNDPNMIDGYPDYKVLTNWTVASNEAISSLVSLSANKAGRIIYASDRTVKLENSEEPKWWGLANPNNNVFLYVIQKDGVLGVIQVTGQTSKQVANLMVNNRLAYAGDFVGTDYRTPTYLKAETTTYTNNKTYIKLTDMSEAYIVEGTDQAIEPFVKDFIIEVDTISSDLAVALNNMSNGDSGDNGNNNGDNGNDNSGEQEAELGGVLPSNPSNPSTPVINPEGTGEDDSGTSGSAGGLLATGNRRR